MKEVIIHRYRVEHNYSLGHCYIQHKDGIVEYVGVTLERGWRNNQNSISCVPEGTYTLKLEWSPRFRKMLWELYGVPNRSECKFHAANYWRQLNGCISLGNKHKDIDGDGDPDVTSSRNAMKLFHTLMGNGRLARVTIKNVG